MRIYTLIAALLLYTCSWICVSGSEPHTVQVQSGQDITLLCSNVSKVPTQTEWFRVVNRTKPRCISSMFDPNSTASNCDGFKNRFEMSSNVSTVFLKIKKVDSSDAGLYFCGLYIDAHTVISSATYLTVEGDDQLEEDVDSETQKNSKEETNMMTVTLTGLCVVLSIVIILLAITIRKLQTAATDEAQPKEHENPGSDDLNYAALRFQKRTKNQKPASRRELEPNVIYAATR